MKKKIEALFEAIDKYDIIAIDKLIKEGVDVNTCWKGYTPLTYLMEVMGCDDCCGDCDDDYYKVEEIARLLVEAGADVNAVNEYGETALSHAMESKSPKVIEILLKHGAKTSTQLKNHRIAAKRK